MQLVDASVQMSRKEEDSSAGRVVTPVVSAMVGGLGRPRPTGVPSAEEWAFLEAPVRRDRSARGPPGVVPFLEDIKGLVVDRWLLLSYSDDDS